jgi:hypothetical protein
MLFGVVTLSLQRPELLEFDWSAIDRLVREGSRDGDLMGVPIWFIGKDRPTRRFFATIPLSDRKAHELVRAPVVHDEGTLGTSVVVHKVVRYPLFTNRLRNVQPRLQSKFGKYIELGKYAFETRWMVLSVETMPFSRFPPTPTLEDPTGLLDVSLAF